MIDIDDLFLRRWHKHLTEAPLRYPADPWMAHMLEWTYAEGSIQRAGKVLASGDDIVFDETGCAVGVRRRSALVRWIKKTWRSSTIRRHFDRALHAWRMRRSR